jgi:hypothetical protein
MSLKQQALENVVIGSGPNGILISNLLIKQGKRVLLVEAGDFGKESALLTRKSYNFLTPSKIPEGVHLVGGGSTQWLGRVGEFYDSDYLAHANRTQNWPINKKEMNQYFKKLYSLLLNDDELDIDFIKNEQVVSEFQRILPSTFALRIFRFSNLEIFAQLLNALLLKQEFQILTRSFCTEIINNDSGTYTLLIKNELGTCTEIVAKRVIIAGGTLQSTALLLRSEKLTIPSREKVLGNYLMEHFDGFIGDLLVRKQDTDLLSRMCLDDKHHFENKKFGISFSLSHREIKKLGFPNLHFEIVPYKKHFIFEPLAFGSWIPDFIRKRIFFLERVLRYAITPFLKKYDELKGQRRFTIWMKGEEFPNLDSTLRLSIQMESFLNPKLEYNHKVSEITSKMVREEIQFVRSQLEINRLGKFLPYRSLMNKRHSFYLQPNWHPMGTCLMGDNPLFSICDANLELHTNKNLFLLNAGVFPTGSNQNPTSMVMALAFRLAQHLESHK